MRVFISHSHEDRELADYLADRLSEAGHAVWRPEEQLLPGDNFALKTGQALAESDAMVILVSPQSVRSQSVRGEINYALGSPNYAGRVIPVMVRPTKDMPWFLRTLDAVEVGTNRDQASKSIIDALQPAPR